MSTIASTVMKLIYNATVEDFPGAQFLVLGGFAMLTFFFTLLLYYHVWKHESRFGTIGGDQNQG